MVKSLQTANIRFLNNRLSIATLKSIENLESEKLATSLQSQMCERAQIDAHALTKKYTDRQDSESSFPSGSSLLHSVLKIFALLYDLNWLLSSNNRTSYWLIMHL